MEVTSLEKAAASRQPMTFWKIRGKNGSGSLSMVDAFFFLPGLW